MQLGYFEAMKRLPGGVICRTLKITIPVFKHDLIGWGHFWIIIRDIGASRSA